MAFRLPLYLDRLQGLTAPEFHRGQYVRVCWFEGVRKKYMDGLGRIEYGVWIESAERYLVTFDIRQPVFEEQIVLWRYCPPGEIIKLDVEVKR